jgi:hypothetical protein
MRKLIFIFAAVAILLCGCNNQLDMPQFPGLPDVELEPDAYNAEIDDEALLEALYSNAIVRQGEYRWIDGEWVDEDIDGEITQVIICNENEAYMYNRGVHHGPIEEQGPYKFSYDADTNTIYTESITVEGVECRARVIYFDGEYLLLDGLFAPQQGYLNIEDYENRRYLMRYKLFKELRDDLYNEELWPY